MKVKELIEVLKNMPQDMNVNIFDYKQNLFVGGGEPSSAGVDRISIETIEVIPSDEEVSERKNDEFGNPIKQWVGLCYSNSDYDDDGVPNDDTLLADYFMNPLSR